MYKNHFMRITLQESLVNYDNHVIFS